MVLLGVQLAQALTVLLVTACVLLGLLAVVVHLGRRTPPQVLQPVYARRTVRRATGDDRRPLSADLTSLPSRDPPPVPPFRTLFGPNPDREIR